MTKKFSVGALMSFCPPAWLARNDRQHGGDWWTGEFYVDTVQRFEKAGMDYVFFLDTQAVRVDDSGSMADALRMAVTAPSQDPIPLLAQLAAATERIGLIGTASTTFYPPYLLARLLSTLDSMSKGRIGWNIVMSFEKSEAQNYGFDTLPDHDERYERAEEYVDLVRALWESWEPGSLLRDEASETYVDPDRVHRIDFVGEHYTSTGPLNVVRSPQGVPFLAQAGASPRGRQFAAKNAELIFVPVSDGMVQKLRADRDDLRKLAHDSGRNPDSIKTVFPASVIFTEQQWKPGDGIPASDLQVTAAVTWLSQSIDMDLSVYPLDEPLPAGIEPSGIRSMSEPFHEMARVMPLRDAILHARYGAGDLNFFGTPEQVAQKLIEFVDAVGGDGVILPVSYESNAEYIDKITNELLPALRAAGVLEEPAEPGTTLREHFFGAGALPPHATA
ncbi:MAG TPA: NtaA/DmoA family FMN-dependent monooxygenase [Pseudolysinimonas sp.]|nr:NtaA/DmoA family FMN-dependent monooxygenase [Pseudolysinimonas sp.]